LAAIQGDGNAAIALFERQQTARLGREAKPMPAGNANRIVEIDRVATDRAFEDFHETPISADQEAGKPFAVVGGSVHEKGEVKIGRGEKNAWIRPKYVHVMFHVKRFFKLCRASRPPALRSFIDYQGILAKARVCSVEPGIAPPICNLRVVWGENRSILDRIRALFNENCRIFRDFIVMFTILGCKSGQQKVVSQFEYRLTMRRRDAVRDVVASYRRIAEERDHHPQRPLGANKRTFWFDFVKSHGAAPLRFVQPHTS
jgi:hypothetical protein